MNPVYAFKPFEAESIIQRFGQAFYDNVLRNLETYAEQWSLSEVQLIPSYSANQVFKCRSEAHGSSVLKLGNPDFGSWLRRRVPFASMTGTGSASCMKRSWRTECCSRNVCCPGPP